MRAIEPLQPHASSAGRRTELYAVAARGEPLHSAKRIRNKEAARLYTWLKNRYSPKLWEMHAIR